MQSFELRNARTADAERLAALHRSAVVTGYANIFPRSSEAPDIETLRVAWAGVLANHEAVVIVAESAAAIVGSVALALDATLPTGVVLKRLHVEPDQWGQGIGAALHDAAVEAARSNGHDAINLWVLEHNVRARQMYERRGWQLVMPLQTLANQPAEVLDVLYEKRLAPVHSSEIVAQ